MVVNYIPGTLEKLVGQLVYLLSADKEIDKTQFEGMVNEYGDISSELLPPDNIFIQFSSDSYRQIAINRFFKNIVSDWFINGKVYLETLMKTNPKSYEVIIDTTSVFHFTKEQVTFIIDVLLMDQIKSEDEIRISSSPVLLQIDDLMIESKDADGPFVIDIQDINNEDARLRLINTVIKSIGPSRKIGPNRRIAFDVCLSYFKNQPNEKMVDDWTPRTYKDVRCITPWYELYIKPNGDLQSCCDNTFDSSAGNINDVTIPEAFNSIHYKNIRQHMQSGGREYSCSRCYKKEDITGSSLRKRREGFEYLEYLDLYGYQSNNVKRPSWSDPFNKNLEEEQIIENKKLEDKFVDDFYDNLKVEWHHRNIRKLKIDFSNGCNLKCTMCSPHRSTAWFKDKIAIDQSFNFNDGYKKWNDVHWKLDKNLMTEFSKSIPIEFIDNEWETIKNLNIIEVSGGEPLYHPQFLYLLDKLVDNNWNGRLQMISNITLMSDDIIEKLQKIRTAMCISIDGCYDLYEYIRPATTIGKYKWNQIESTVDKLKANNMRFTFGFVPQLLNFYNIIDWLEWSTSKLTHPELDRLSTTVLHSPHILKICHHPDEDEKQKLAEQLKEWKHIRGVDSIIKGLKDKTTPADWKAFCKYINFLDKQRETSIIKYVPQFEKYWITE